MSCARTRNPNCRPIARRDASSSSPRFRARRSARFVGANSSDESRQMSEATELAAPATKLAPRFWRLWWASSISALGDGVTMAALPLLAASLSSDPRLVSGIATAGTLPWLVFFFHSRGPLHSFHRLQALFYVDACPI